MPSDSPAVDDVAVAAADGEPRGRRPRLDRVATIALPAVAYGALAWVHRWTSDDGFIFFRVVDELLHGHGPVFNGGERVEIATSPLWVGVLALFRVLTFGVVRLEYLALWLSLVGALFGLVAACRASSRIATAAATGARRRTLVPFGALVVVAVAAFWDFATSGLEMGLVFAWMGGSFWALVAFAACDRGNGAKRHRYLLAVLLGLGPVVRPDLALFSACFLAAEILTDRDARVVTRLAYVGVGLLVPVLYQVFRMGYYAALVPNTAIAKSAGSTQWHRGDEYLRNLMSSYHLEIPLALITLALAVTITRLMREGGRPLAVVVVATVVAGVLHGLYVVAIGGDFFHGRLLLPALFALVMPVAVVAVSDAFVLGIVAVVAAWAVVSAVALRPLGSDQRAFYVHESGHAHPVTLDDYRDTDAVRAALQARRDAQRGRRVLVIPTISTFFVHNGRNTIDFGTTIALRRDIPQRAGLAWTGIGALSYAAGPDVFVVDRLGLGDPIGSRLSGFPSYLPIGHQRFMSRPWVEARAAAPDARDRNPLNELARQVAVDALRCGRAATLLHDVRDGLTPRRFAGNVLDSFSLTTLRIPQAVVEAHEELCR